MTRIGRYPVLAVLGLLVLLPPSAARAADPPTLGATLGATPETIVIDSTASVRQLVTVTVPQGWAVAETSFAVDPGERRRVPITASGPAGQIVATFEAIDLAPGIDTSTLVLSLGVAPAPPDLGLLLWAVLFTVAALGVVTVTWRRRHALRPS